MFADIHLLEYTSTVQKQLVWSIITDIADKTFNNKKKKNFWLLELFILDLMDIQELMFLLLRTLPIQF